mgnify:CR=1 FL=1
MLALQEFFDSLHTIVRLFDQPDLLPDLKSLLPKRNFHPVIVIQVVSVTSIAQRMLSKSSFSW